MIQRIFKLMTAFLVLGCARVQTLNMEPHAYSERPRHIVWVQIAGFSEEHLPLLKFNVPDVSNKTSFENADCVGKLWAFNLYELRPDAGKSFLSQLNGSRNIKGRCEDFIAKSAWGHLNEMGYASSILENGSGDDNSLERSMKCPQSGGITPDKISFYRMGPESNAETGEVWKKSFHYQDSAESISNSIKPGIYYDKSCQKNVCYSSISNNFKTLWLQTMKERNSSFFLVRDFNFQKALRKKDIVFAKESLLEVERIMNIIRSAKRDDILVLVTGAESLNVEFPKEGKEWAEFERSGKNMIFRNSALQSPVFAKGPMSENFCGMFDESEMLKRILYRPEHKKFNWDLLNPL
jgi:hypothetical protein